MSNFGTPYWWEHGAPLPDLSTTPPTSAEFVIVGAGFTGLSAAIAAQRAGAKVTVIDAGVPGKGASTRNGGMAGTYPRDTLRELTAAYGATTADQLYNEQFAAKQFAEKLIQENAIDCDYEITGRIQLAWTKAHFAKQQTTVADLKARTNFNPKVVDLAGLKDHINTDRYFGGIYLPDHGGLHPRKFHDGLMRVALELGVTIIQNCPVIEIDKGKERPVVHTANGSLTADKLLVATNGYTHGRGVLRWLGRRFFPLPSFIIATEQVSKERIDRIAPGKRLMVETRARHSYYRISPDGTRILWGGRASMVPLNAHEAANKLRKSLVEIWPEFGDVAITHSWSGNTGFAHGMLPHVGRENGVFYAMGYCGSGVVMAPYLGMKAAYQMLNDPRGDTVYSRIPLQTKLYHPTPRPHFLKAGNIWYNQVVDNRQARQARRDRARS